MLGFGRPGHVLALYGWESYRGAAKLLDICAGDLVEFNFLQLKKKPEVTKGTFPLQAFFNNASSFRVLGNLLFCWKSG